MNEQYILSYDNTFEGFLTAVFYVFERNLDGVNIQKKTTKQDSLFVSTELIVTDIYKAERVWQAIKIKMGVTRSNQLYRTFLSEIKGVEKLLLNYIGYAFSKETSVCAEDATKDASRIAQVSKMVSREKERIELGMPLKVNDQDIHFASISPDFNVLPLIIKYLKRKYPNKQWMVYDAKRDYGVCFDLHKVEMVHLNLKTTMGTEKIPLKYFGTKESKLEAALKDIFDKEVKVDANIEPKSTGLSNQFRKMAREKSVA